MEEGKEILDAGDERSWPWAGLAQFRAIPNDHEQALDWLERAIELGGRYEILSVYDSKSLENEPRFLEMKARAKADVDLMRARVRQMEREFGWG